MPAHHCRVSVGVRRNLSAGVIGQQGQCTLNRSQVHPSYIEIAFKKSTSHISLLPVSNGLWFDLTIYLRPCVSNAFIIIIVATKK